MSNAVVIIPARMGSSRLPNKPLVDINGKTLIQRVYENALACYSSDDVYIAAGDQEIIDEAECIGAKSVLTDPNLPSGTDRIAAALRQIDPNGTRYDVVINFQGDGLNVDPKINEDLIRLMKSTKADITTVAQKITSPELIHNPAYVKIALSMRESENGENGEKAGRCVYFSRNAIPHDRDAGGLAGFAYWHIGMYVYNADSLQRFIGYPVGVLERIEKLEQLRALENGMSIFALLVEDIRLVPEAPADINTEEELAAARKYIF